MEVRRTLQLFNYYESSDLRQTVCTSQLYSFNYLFVTQHRSG